MSTVETKHIKNYEAYVDGIVKAQLFNLRRALAKIEDIDGHNPEVVNALYSAIDRIKRVEL